uniref:Acetyl-coenzyme A synthetase, cytoplasmic n=1 Tax=Astatotilapia calliptera TaxID=8154 RepID=A0AAX7SWR5_ASTCA
MVVPESQDKMYYPLNDLQKDAHVPDFNSYLALYQKSLENPEAFWKEVADEFFWKKPATAPMLQYNFDVTKGSVYVKYMEGAKTNMCYNVLDRHVREGSLGEKVAYYWEGNSPDHQMAITYSQLLSHVCRCANVLKQMGVKKGDRVSIYLPMIPELVYTMLACARIGAVHSIVFAGFSCESLCERIVDAQSSVLVTAGRSSGSQVFVLSLRFPRCGRRINCTFYPFTPWDSQCDVWWDEAMRDSSEECEPEWLDAEDPLFILYTSGSTGKPKGVLHTVAGYLLYTSMTFKYVFDHHHDDVYWCTADIGWITGHSYITYGPLANGATSVLFEGIPVHPHVGRFWEVIEKYKVTKFYTAPTAIRLLMKYGREPLQKYDLSSLRILGTVGEPINPEAWQWYYEVVGQSRCPIVDTFWQTETVRNKKLTTEVLLGTMAVTPLFQVFRRPWPGIMRTVFKNHERFENTYFKKFPGFYVTGDGCRRDKDGYYWITGRIDDMLNVSGHLMSTAEVEAALTEHAAVAEAAVVSRPHKVKGESLYCFVTLKDSREFSHTLVDELKRLVREKIGPIATPDFIQNAPALPKTRSGKIMRRILRQIARNDKDLGDLSTLADPKVVEVLFSQRYEAAA